MKEENCKDSLTFFIGIAFRRKLIENHRRKDKALHSSHTLINKANNWLKNIEMECSNRLISLFNNVLSSSLRFQKME